MELMKEGKKEEMRKEFLRETTADQKTPKSRSKKECTTMEMIVQCQSQRNWKHDEV